jgi:N-acetyltransferase
MKVTPVQLVGRRVALVPLEASHTRALYEAGRHPKIWDYMFMRVETPDEMHRLVQEALSARDAGTELPFVIVDRETGRIVGSTRFLDIAPAHRGLEIGWTWLAPEVWRTPINTECKYLLLRHCFEVLGAVRVQFKTDARNIRSQRALERIGAHKEGVLRRHRILPDGYIRDSVYYSIIAEEWPAVRRRLEDLLPSAWGSSAKQSSGGSEEENHTEGDPVPGEDPAGVGPEVADQTPQRRVGGDGP